MGVYLHLQGRYLPPKNTSDPVDAWLQLVENWFEDDLADDALWGTFLYEIRRGVDNDHPALYVQLYTQGEEVSIRVPTPGSVVVSAKTSTVGPGYHIALCELFHRLSDDFQIEWHPQRTDDDESDDESDDSSSDSTGYFFGGTREAVESEMLTHLKTMAKLTADMFDRDEYQSIAWSMPLSHTYRIETAGVRTPLGVRDPDWVRAVLDDPRNGIDVYPWWGEPFSAQFYHGRALGLLWSEMRWREPQDTEEADLWFGIHEDLTEAHARDPKLPYPWREWLELITILDEYDYEPDVDDDLLRLIQAKAAAMSEEVPLIGYRRHPVTVRLTDGWTIDIPGAMAERWEEATWSAWDGVRTVWFTCWSFQKPDGEAPSAEEILAGMKGDEGERIHHERGEVIGHAITKSTEEDGEVLLNLQAFSAVEGRAALCNIFYHDESDAEWAVDTWKTMTNTAKAQQADEED